MNRRRYSAVIAFVVLLVIGTYGSFVGSPTWTMIAFIVSMLGNIVSGAVIETLDAQGFGLRIWWQHIRYWNTKIRMSFAYQFRILINGRYLVIRGNRVKRYIPVGGVYKYYEEAKPALESIDFTPDFTMGNYNDADDLRIDIKGRYILKFLNWFYSQQNREYDPRREFLEELISEYNLPADAFANLQYRKVNVHNEGITFSTYNQIYEYVYADVFELKLTAEQELLIANAVENNPDTLYLATCEEMESMCCDNQCVLGTNCPWNI